MFLVFFIPVMAGASKSSLPNGVELELIVRQKPALIEKYFEITRDTIRVLIGKRINTFLVNFGLEISIIDADSQFVDFTSQLVTIGSTPFNLSKRFRTEFNLPARLENIPGKNGTFYQLLISPRNFTDIDTAGCEYNPNDSSQFKFDPSPNFDFYYVKNSLADFHWNYIKNYIETDYVRFRDAFDLTSSGKMNFFLCPCPAPSINWDKRFGYAIDPGRGNIYSIYDRDFASSEPILPNMLRLLRLWGYAPPILVEGLGGYFEFSSYEMKKIKERGEIPPIKNLLTSAGYYAADAQITEITAASFVKYLTDRYGFSKTKQLYEKSDDLTLLENLELTYGRTVDSLDLEWRHYVDTISLGRFHFDFFAMRAGALFRSDKQIEYCEEMTKYDKSRADSIDTWKKLSTLYYQYGRYYKAEEGYRQLIALDSARAVYHQILANLLIIDGRYDAAWRNLDSVLTLDSTYATARLLQAEILTIRGDTAGAIKLADDIYEKEKSIPGKIEFLLFLGKMRGTKGSHYDSVAANRDFSDALAWATDMLNKVPEDPSHKLRAGLACLGLREYKKAGQYLDVAFFTEHRTYYRGEILLALGNLYDLLGNRAKAKEYYQQGLAAPLAVFERDLCMKYIDKPYRN